MKRMPRISSIALVLLLALSHGAQGQDGPAAEAETEQDPASPQLLADGGYGWPALAVGPDGVRHLVATQLRAPGADERVSGDLWYATDRDGSWTLSRLLRGKRDLSGLGWDDASIAVDRDGSVHIAVVHDYIGSTPSETEGIYYLTDAGRAPGEFAPPVRIARAGATAPSLAVRDGARYLIFGQVGQPGDPPMPTPVTFKTDHSGAWETYRLARDGGASELAVDGSGRVHIIYVDPADDGLRSHLRYLTYDPPTRGLSATRRVPGPRGYWYDMALALGPSGEPHVAWTTDRAISWQRRMVDGWDAPATLPVQRVDALSLEVDPDGRPHLVFAGRSEAGRGLLHAQPGAGRWHQGVIATGAPWATVSSALDGSDLSVAWAPSPWSDTAGLWSLGPVPATDPAARAAESALMALLEDAADTGCVPFTEQGDNDPFSFGAVAAIQCPAPARGVRQLALFRFPDAASLTSYWNWRVGQVQPRPKERDGACADGRRGRTRWEHGGILCYVSVASGEARLRWTDERSGTYGVLDGRGRAIADVYAAWVQLQDADAREG